MVTVDYIIHLAYANVAEKWWSKKEENHIGPRTIKGGDNWVVYVILKTLTGYHTTPASAIGWYGPGSGNV